MNSRLLAVGPTTTRSGRLRPNRATPSHGNGTFALHGTGVVPTPAEPPSTAGRTAAPVLGSRTGAAERPGDWMGTGGGSPEMARRRSAVSRTGFGPPSPLVRRAPLAKSVAHIPP